MSRVTSTGGQPLVHSPLSSGAAKGARRSAGGGDAGGFGDQLAESYRLLSNDEEALEAAKIVVQVLPWLSAPKEELRLVQGGVVARGAAAMPRREVGRARGAGQGARRGAPNNLTLHLRIEGSSVDIAAWAAHRQTVEELLAARELVAEALAQRGLTLRRLVAAESPAEGGATSARRFFDHPALRRSYMEVIA